MTSLSISSSDIIALVALAISAYAAWKTVKFNDRQKSLIETQERLNRLLLEKEQGDLLAGKRADPGATMLRLGSNNYRIKIWNKGKSAARNVSIDFPDGNELVDDSDVAERFPLQILDPHQAVDLVAFVHMETKGKHAVKIRWSDDAQSENEKTVYITL